MTKLIKIGAVLAVILFALAAVTTTAQAATCRPEKVAMAAPCVQAQMANFSNRSAYSMRTEVLDMGGGTMHVDFYLVPKCLNDPIPCRIATQCVDANVFCPTQTATCL